MFLVTYKYRPEDVACPYCVRYRACRQEQSICPWLRERLEAGVVSYAELMLSLLDNPHCPIDCRRMAELLDSYPATLWNSGAHQTHYRWLEGNVPLGRPDTNRLLAAAYLLAATPGLLRFSKACLTAAQRGGQSLPGTEGLSPSELTMLSAAFSLITRPGLSSIGELLSREHADLISTRHTAHALLIAQYGPNVLKVTD